jgi:hypothetical protein
VGLVLFGEGKVRSSDPSSSEQSCDTVIYLGPALEDATDNEHPPAAGFPTNNPDNCLKPVASPLGQSSRMTPSTDRYSEHLFPCREFSWKKKS